MSKRIYGAQRAKLIEFIEAKGGAEVSGEELRTAFPNIQTSTLTSLLQRMVIEGDVDRKYRGVYVAKPAVSAANS